MDCETYFYRCSKDYIDTINDGLYSEIINVINQLPKREKQDQVNLDLFWLFTSKAWAFDSLPSMVNSNEKLEPLSYFKIQKPDILEMKKSNNRNLCKTSATLGLKWQADFAKKFNNNLVQIEAQFGQTESMFKDFCGFKIANYEKRLALGVEIVMSHPTQYFKHRKSEISGMASFNIAKETLQTINLDCPIWLIGIRENLNGVEEK